MQREFQVGDRVRVTKEMHPSDHLERRRGKVEVIARYLPDNKPFVWEAESGVCYAPDQLELIEPAKSHRFKVGDRVQIIGSGHPVRHHHKVGEIGRVKRVLLYDLEVIVKGLSQAVSMADVELVEDTADKVEISSSPEKFAEIFRQTMTLSPMPIFTNWDQGYSEPKPSSATGIMGRVKTLARKLLDKDTQSLIEAGVLTNDLSVRDTDFVLSFLVNQYKKELAIEARAKIKAERDEDED